MEIYDVVKKLVGEIKPIGETNEDNRRFKNLKVMSDLVDRLIYDIDNVAAGNNSYMDSIKKAGKFADEFLTQLGIEE